MMHGYISMGSNLGDREEHLRAAVKGLAAGGVAVISLSDVYETLPVETDDAQPAYLNAVAEVTFEGTPLELLGICRKIEADLGRARPYRHAPRTIDLDILLTDGVKLRTPELTLPHPRMEGRAFVIFPLADVAPDLVLGSGRSVREVKKGLKGDEIIDVWTMKWKTGMTRP